MAFKGLLGFHIYADDLRIYYNFSFLDLKRCYDYISLNLQIIHEWAMANELKLNPKKNQIIHRCGADVRPRTLLIGANFVKVASKVKGFGFVFKKIRTAKNHFRKMFQRVYWILRSLKPHTAHTP
jgi:hypothetical protein